MKRKIISACLACLLSIALTCGCGTKAPAAGENKPAEAEAPEAPDTGNKESASEDPIRVVASVFPAYDWARNVIGDAAGADLTLLVDSGVDLHSYQPSVEDILTISTCDLFIYVGGESDRWATDALAQAVNEDMVVIKLLDELGSRAREEEIVEGMEEKEEEEEEGALDEHVWLSLKNAEVLTEAIEKALAEIDPDNASLYEDNLAAYTEKLSALDEAYARAVEEGTHDTLLFGDRFPFRYLTEDYGLKYYAAFAGCSAETEASFETILFLADKADELGLSCILTIDGSDQKIAGTVAQTAKSGEPEILTLNSIQSITKEDMEAGTTYLSVMEENLEVLKKALQ